MVQLVGWGGFVEKFQPDSAAVGLESAQGTFRRRVVAKVVLSCVGRDGVWAGTDSDVGAEEAVSSEDDRGWVGGRVEEGSDGGGRTDVAVARAHTKALRC